MLNKLKSQKGSSFVYVLVVITILVLLSGTVITMTVANYKLGITKGGRNTAFYFADGAIDEALAEIEEISHRSESYASGIIQDDHADFKTTEKWVEFEKWLETNQDSDDLVTGIENDGGDNYLTSEEVTAIYDEALNREYTKQYLMELLGATDDDVDKDYSLIKKAENESEEDTFVGAFDLEFKNVNGLKSNYTSALETVVFDPNKTDGFEDIQKSLVTVESKYLVDDKAVRVTLVSSGKYNIYNKGVEVVVDMKPPKHDYLTVTSVKRKALVTNDLLENSMTARKDIIVLGGEVTAKGDVYALGTFRDSIDVTHGEKGGVIVGYDEINNNYLNVHSDLALNEVLSSKGALHVVGNVKTAASVKPSKSNSTLHVEGAVHADSFMVNADATDTTTTINDSIFLMDDMYIMASDTTITVGEDGFTPGNAKLEDSFISYLDGLEYNQGNKSLNNPDLSSSIRIDKQAKNVKIALDSLYIPGVAYINVYRDEKIDESNTVRKYYQTGESFTTEKNYFFYQEKLENQEERTEEVTYTDGVDEFALVEYVDADGNIQSSAKYKVEHFLNRVINEYQKDAAIRDDEIVATGDKEIVTIRSMAKDTLDATDVTIYEDNYALGVFQGNGRIYNPMRLKMQSDSFIDTVKNSSNLTSDLYMYQLGYRDYKNGKMIRTIDVALDQVEMLDQYIDFTRESDFTTINTSGRLVVLDNSENADVYINVPAEDIPPNSEAIIYNGSNNIKGAIATKGDIYIYNGQGNPDFVFTGSMIAGGSIVLYGDGKKIIENYDGDVISTALTGKNGTSIESHAKVYGIVGSSTVLTDAFHVIDGRKLVAKFVDPSAEDKSYTRSIHFNLDLDIVDKTYDYIKDQDMPAQVDVSMMSTPELEGSTKEEEVRGYELVHWREVKPSN